MPGDEELYLNGGGRATSVYQQPSTGEKHVLFYPTSPAPSANSEERHSWSQASSSFANNHAINNHKFSSSSTDTTRMKKTEGTTTTNPTDSDGSHREQNNTLETTDSRYNFKIGIYGWRKRCLYMLILGLLIMVIVNLALTLWVLKVMEFSSEGMGQLKIVSGGLRLEGKAFVLDTLIASSIRSRTGQPIIIESSRNLTLSTRNADGRLSNWMYLGNDRFECLANNFKVMDDRGLVLFSADDQEVYVGSESLRVTGEGGTIFSGSIQTPLVRAESGHDLRLESPTRSLEIKAPQSIHIESRGGKVKAIAFSDVTLKSEEGAIKLESSSIIMPDIPTAVPTTSRSVPNRNHDIFQLCVCSNGKLFLAPPHMICSAEEDDRVCR